MKNPVDSYESNGVQFFTVEGTGGPRVAFKGIGVLSSRIRREAEGNTGMICGFQLMQPTMTEASTDSSGRTAVGLDTQSSLPCSGFIASTGEGYIIGPAFRLQPVKGQDVILMFLAPRTKPYSVSIEKTMLAVPGEAAEVTVTAEEGEIRCIGTISGRAKEARLFLNRSPRLPVNKRGFDETLSHIKGEGQITANWKPLARSFDKLVVAFYSSRVLSDDFSWGLDRIAKKLGSPDPAETAPLDYVIGDGIGVDYTLRLTIDRGLGRHDTDEARVTVT